MSKRRKLGRPKVGTVGKEGRAVLEVPRRRPPSLTKVREETLRTTVMALTALDNALYSPGGLLTRFIRRDDKETLIEEVKAAAKTGLTLRQRMLDIATREFGAKGRSLKDDLPHAISPPGEPEEDVLTFYGDIRRRLDDHHALVIAEPPLLSLAEWLGGSGAGEPSSVIVGFVPWEYVLLAPKTPGLRDALGLQKDPEKWEKGVAYEFLPDTEEPTLRTVSRPDDPEMADTLYQWLFREVLHPRLVQPPDMLPGDERKPFITERGA